METERLKGRIREQTQSVPKGGVIGKNLGEIQDSESSISSLSKM